MPEKKSVVNFLIWNFLTLGIYGLIYWTKFGKQTNKMIELKYCKKIEPNEEENEIEASTEREYDESEDKNKKRKRKKKPKKAKEKKVKSVSQVKGVPPYIVMAILSIFTFGISNYIWFYKEAKAIESMGKLKNIKTEIKAKPFLIQYIIFGLLQKGIFTFLAFLLFYAISIGTRYSYIDPNALMAKFAIYMNTNTHIETIVLFVTYNVTQVFIWICYTKLTKAFNYLYDGLFIADDVILPGQASQEGVFKYLSFEAVQTEIRGYGFEYSFKKYLGMLFGSFALIIVLGLKIFQLHIPNLIIIGVGYAIFFPSMLIEQFKYMYEQKRFRDVNDYLEQMIFTFKKKSKILESLKDCLDLTSGRIHELIEEAILYIEEKNDSENLYREGLAIIEKEYACDRMEILHDFLVRVELQGGTYQGTLNIIYDDIKMWTERVYGFQKDRASMKVGIIISLGAAMLVCGATGYMFHGIPLLAGVYQKFLYQTVTTIVLLAFIALFLFTQRKLTGTWLKVDHAEDTERINRCWDILENYDAKKERKKSIIIAVILLPLIILAISTKQTVMVVASFIILAMVIMLPSSKVKKRKNYLIAEIEKKFPLWLRGIALALQTENVYVAILKSIDTAPYVLRPALRQLIDEIEQDPVTIAPYNNFLSEYDMPEIKSSIKMLFSLTNYGSDDAEGQINNLINRNNQLLDQSERLENKDEIAVCSTISFVPMIIGVMKMMVDLLLVFGQIFSSLGGV